jgi:hypothetical protein
MCYHLRELVIEAYASLGKQRAHDDRADDKLGARVRACMHACIRACMTA